MTVKTTLMVLVVDDHEDTRVVLRQVLQAKGCDVAEALDGEAAVEAVIRMHPDLILMDLNMPRLDGLEAAQQIRQLKGIREKVPIIAVTAFDTYGMKEAALESGCDDYLTKPIDMEQFERSLRGLLPLWF